MAAFEVVTAAASVSPKGEDLNEDRIDRFGAEGSEPGAGVVLCDGLGSMPESAAVAGEVSAWAVKHLTERGVQEGIWRLERELDHASFESRDGATTLLAIGAEGNGLVGHAMIGNGSLIEVAAVEPWPGATRLLWTDISLPQIAWSGDRPGLRSVLPSENGPIEVAKGFRYASEKHARMYLACSDGISSEEEREEGAAPDGSRWKQVPSILTLILDRIGREWTTLLGLAAVEVEEALRASLWAALDAAGDPASIDDDATVGAVLLRPHAPPADSSSAAETTR